VRGAGIVVEGMWEEAEGAGRERAEKEGVEREEAAEDDVVEVRVERKAVRRAFEWIATGTSSRMLEGTSLFSIKLFRSARQRWSTTQSTSDETHPAVSNLFAR